MSDRRCKDWLASYIEYTEQSESPNSFHIWSGLSAIASCIQRKVWMNMGHFKVFPNMYVVLVGPPGCRKNSAINIAIGLLEGIPEVKYSADAITRQALTQFMKASEQQIEGVLKDKPYTHTSVTIISKELSVFIGNNNIELLSLLTDLYDPHDKWEYRTKNSGVDTLRGVWLNMLAGTTPTWLVGSIPMNAIGGGFTSRVIFVVEYGPRKKNAVPIITEKEVKLRENLIYDLEQISLIKGQMEFNPVALEWYRIWYEETPPSELAHDPRFEGYYERKHIHLLKLAMILSLSKSSKMVLEVEDLEQARNIIEGTEARMTDAFGAAGRSLMANDIDDIMKLIKSTGEISHRQLLHSVWRDVAPENVDSVLRVLKDMGLIEEKVKEGSLYYVATGKDLNIVGG